MSAQAPSDNSAFFKPEGFTENQHVGVNGMLG